MHVGAVLLGLSLAMLAPAAAATAQRGGNEGVFRGYLPDNVPYDGQFTFARIMYGSALGPGFGRGRGSNAWSHDYPRGERHFTRILSELTTVAARTQESNILTLDDPDLFRFPIAYLCEPGYWVPTDAEVRGLRNYLLKGGFIMFDDFYGQDWYNFEAQMKRVLPEHRIVELTVDHPIFDSFYRIRSLDFNHPYIAGYPSRFLGIFENNEPAGRLMAIINYNNDIGEYWEFSDTGMFPIDLSNEAYKLGINYIVYALTR